MKGLIAFFDILGYQSLLKNTTAEESVKTVFKLITETPAKVKEKWALWAERKPDTTAELLDVAGSLKHLVFSDTIVLYISYPPSASPSWMNSAMIHLALSAGYFSCQMFEDGLPMRGAVIEGEFFVETNSCFAGKAIVDAYKLCTSLDFAGLVCEEKVATVLKALWKPRDYDRLFVPYLSPVKRSPGEVRLTHINWTVFIGPGKEVEVHSDIEMFVYRAFWAHGKDCDLSVEKKLYNTIKLVRRLLIALESPIKKAVPPVLNQ
jgi:hypothetical protein